MRKLHLFASLAISAAASVASADITGKVALEGTAPAPAEIDMSAVAACAGQHADPVMEESVVIEEGGLGNVIIAIKTDDPAALGGEAPTKPVMLDQKGCMYEPHVLSMTAGQDLLVKNSDAFMHNVHSFASVNTPFNYAQPNVHPGLKVDDPPKVQEYFQVKCDVHPWMSAYVGVFEHPFHAVSKPDGTFTIKGKLPDGEYTMVAWHEKYGEQEQQVTVTDGKAEASFSFNADSAMIDPDVEVLLASSTEQKSKEGAACCNTKLLQRSEQTAKAE